MDGDGVALTDHLGHPVTLARELESLGSGNVVDLDEIEFERFRTKL